MTGRRYAGAWLLVIGSFLLRCDPAPPHSDGNNAVFPRTPASAGNAAPVARRGAAPHPGAAPRAFLEHPLTYLSTAPADSLILLPGIGPVIAERLASARTGKRLFTRWEELRAVKGIGPKKLRTLRRLAGQTD